MKNRDKGIGIKVTVRKLNNVIELFSANDFCWFNLLSLGEWKLLRRIVSGIMLSLVSIGLLSLAFNIQPARADFGNIYIRADGTVDPPTAPILNVDNVTYILTGDIVTNGSIILQRDNIVVDGAGCTLQGIESEEGIYLSGRINVTVRNMEIKACGCGINLYGSSNNSIYGSNITNNGFGIQLKSFSNDNSISGNNIINNAMGIWLSYSSNNTITGNDVINNHIWGVMLGWSSSNNSVSGNNIIANNDQGIQLAYSSNNNSVFANNITDSNFGIYLYLSSDNKFYHNNFIDNNEQVHFQEPSVANFWDDGYPSGGNYWSDYAGEDENNDGIGDAPYVINADNEDHYPLMNPYGAPPPQTYSLTITITVGGTTDPTPGTYSCIANSTVEVTAIPEANYLFDHWELDSVNVGSANPYPVLIDNDHILHAVFTYEGIHDIAITNVTPSETIVGKGCSMSINVTISNQGDYTENFNLTVYANATSIHVFTNFTLTSGNSTTLTFIWNTTDFAKGDYVMSAYACPVPDETDTDDNLYIDGTVQIVGNWTTSFIGLGGYPIVDFAVYSNELHAASDNTLYVFNGISWNIIDAPTYVLSLEPYQDKLIIGGKNGLYSYDGTTFTLIFTVPNYIKSLGAYNNTLYAGTVLDKPPTLYYCNGSAENHDNWHTDTDFSTILNFSCPFGSIDSFTVYNNTMYVTSGSTVYSYNGTHWNITKTYNDVYAYLDMKVYNGKLYLATRDQAWRKPIYQGGTGFSGRVIEYDGENWTTILDHDYWIFALETYDNKLYAGTANQIYTYNGTRWETSFHSEEGAYYAVSLMTFNNTIYAGMGSGYIFADPSFEMPVIDTITVPEFPSFLILPVFMIATLLAVIVYKRKHQTRNKKRALALFLLSMNPIECL